ncbi:MAG TPA: NTP transferase domain-containing protein [Clostridiales bacterium]|jgi:2-C-methyl-D-erythritol 4-phosphate cytidylyltransferase|nr:NTP transferase domain-containing protein [Clostridiales bacterium]
MACSIGIILAGGIGSRFGADKPKQYCEIFGKEMIWYSVDAFRRSKRLSDFIIVLDEDEMANGRIEKEYDAKTVLGGKSRNESFKNALDYIHKHFPDCEKIIENNAACPMITPELIDEFLDLLDEYDYVNTAYKITDALGSYKHRIADREDFYLIQAPDAYRFELLYKYFDESSTLCHPAHQLPLTAKEYRYFDYTDNYKVTYPHDIQIVEILMNNRKNK